MVVIDELGVGPRLAAFAVAGALALAAGAGLGAVVPALHDRPAGAGETPAGTAPDTSAPDASAPDADHPMDGMEHSDTP